MPTARRRPSSRWRTTSSRSSTWAANPEMVERKQIGWRWVLFFVIMAGLTYAVKRKVWADVH